MECTRIALIPAYQPGDQLLGILQELYMEHYQVIVVDDGSGERYAPVFRNAENYAAVLTHPENRGKGEALKTGLTYIREHFTPPYTVVTADADGQHRIGDICQVTEKAEGNQDALILGSRKFNQDVPLRSMFGNTVTRWVFRLSTGTKVYDTQTGLRAFSDRLLSRMLSIPGSRYEYEMNVLIDCARNGVPMEEIRIETVYLDENDSSHFDTLKDSCRIYKEILKFSASSLTSFLVDYGLFCMLSIMTGQLVLANVMARIVSASLNYTMNKYLVFGHRGKTAQSAAAYFMLAALMMILNTGILRVLTTLGINQFAAKIGTELLLFILSYTAQHTMVFRKEAERS